MLFVNRLGVAGEVTPCNGLCFLRSNREPVDPIDPVVGSPCAIKATSTDIIKINPKVGDELKSLQRLDIQVDLAEYPVFQLPVLVVCQHTNRVVSVAKQVESL